MHLQPSPPAAPAVVQKPRPQKQSLEVESPRCVGNFALTVAMGRFRIGSEKTRRAGDAATIRGEVMLENKRSEMLVKPVATGFATAHCSHVALVDSCFLSRLASETSRVFAAHAGVFRRAGSCCQVGHVLNRICGSWRFAQKKLVCLS